MPRDENKKLVQIQVSLALRKKLESLAIEDRRSLVGECLWLIEQGIKRRSRMESIEDVPPPRTGRTTPRAAKQA